MNTGNGKSGEEVLTLSPRASAQLSRLMERAGGDPTGVVRVLRTDTKRKKPFDVRIKTVGKDATKNLLRQIFDGSRKTNTSDPLEALFAKGLIDSTNAPLASKEIIDGEDGARLSSDDYIPPPYNFDSTATMLTINVMHNACIEAKARDIVSNGYEIVRSKAAADMADSLWEEWKDTAEHFLNSCTYSRMIKGAPIDVALHALATDYLSLGCCGFEVLRSQTGLAVGINHIPFATMRVMREDFERTYGIRFVQIKGQLRNGFIPFGARVKYPIGFDPVTADADAFPKSPDKRAAMFDWADDLPDPRNMRSKQQNIERAATEFHMMARPPFVASQIYGTPSGLTSLAYILAQLEIDKYNIQFFSSKGVPQYACIIEGLTPLRKDTIETDSDEEVSDPYTELENEINEFFTERLLSAERSVMLVTTFGEAKVRFERLSHEKADAAFADYEKRAMEMIRLSHGVPGAAIGILDTANLGSGRDSIQMRRYYSHAILPDQRAFESMINYILRVGTLNPWVEIKLKPVDFEDKDARSEMNLKRFVEGAFTLDEYLVAEGLPPAGEDAGGNLRIIRTSGVTVLNPNPTQAAAALAKLAAKQNEAIRKLGLVLTEALDEAPADNEGDPVE